MTADTLDILTIEAARVAVGLGAEDRKRDNLLESMVTGISRKIDRHAGPVVVRTITAEAHDGGHLEVFLKYRPVSSVTTVTEYDGTTAQVLTATTNAAKPDHGYVLKAAGMLERRSAGSPSTFPIGDGNVVVTYVAGRYATTATVDPLFTRAAVITLKAWFASEDATSLPLGEYDVPSSRWSKFALANATLELLDDLAISTVTMG